MAKITKISSVYLDGQRLPAKEAKLKFGGSKREAVKGMADGEILGHTASETSAPSLEITLAHTDDMSVADYQAIEDATLTAMTSGGKTYVLGEAYCVETGELSNGDVSVTFEALRFTEQKGA